MPLFHCGSGSSIYNGTAVALLQCCLTLGSNGKESAGIHTHTQSKTWLVMEPGFVMWKNVCVFDSLSFPFFSQTWTCDGLLADYVFISPWYLSVDFWRGIRHRCSVCPVVVDIQLHLQRSTYKLAGKTGIKCSRLTWMLQIFVFLVTFIRPAVCMQCWMSKSHSWTQT